MVDKPKPEYEPFAYRLAATCCAKSMHKSQLVTRTKLKRNRITGYENATRFPTGKEILKADGPLKKISRVLGILSTWLVDAERIGLGSLAAAYDEFDALPDDEQTKRANELGWWLEHGRPPKPAQQEKPRKRRRPSK